MEISKRLEILFQAANIAQNKGVLSLDDAVVTKIAIDEIKDNKNLIKNVNILIKVAEVAQERGAFTLKDSFLIYSAIDGIDKDVEEIVNNRESNTVANNRESNTVYNENTQKDEE